MVDRYAHGVFYPDVELLCPDGDGLLWDTEEVLYEVHREMIAERGHELTEVHYRLMVGQGALKAAEIAIDLYKLRIEPEAYRQERIARMQERLPKVPLMPGVERFFEKCRLAKAPVVLVSAGSEEHVATIVDAHRLRPRFAHMVTAGTEGIRALKPEPDLYLHALGLYHKMRIKPFRCVAFEDTVAGVQAANAAGLISVAVPHRFSPREQLKKHARYVLPEGQNIGDFDLTDIKHLLPQR